MNFLRKNWFDLGGVFALIVLVYLAFNYQHLSSYQVLMWLSLVSLFFHQLEEYRIVGTFPGMVNSVMFKSDIPDRYPLNMNSALYVNAFVGWLTYVLAAIFAEKAIWLGLATIFVSVGNIIAHTLLFNVLGKTVYNAGLATSLLFFAPVVYFFFAIAHGEGLITLYVYMIGIPVGIAFNVVGILKLIDWMKDRDTSYVFSK